MVLSVVANEQPIHLSQLLLSCNQIIVELAHACMARYPEDRPSLDDVERRLQQAMDWERVHPLQRPVTVSIGAPAEERVRPPAVAVDSSVATLSATDVPRREGGVTPVVPQRPRRRWLLVAAPLALAVMGVLLFWLRGSVSVLKPHAVVQAQGVSASGVVSADVVKSGIQSLSSLVPSSLVSPPRRPVVEPKNWTGKTAERDRAYYLEAHKAFNRGDCISARPRLVLLALQYPEFPSSNLMVAECARRAYEGSVKGRDAKKSLQHQQAVCLSYRAYNEASKVFDAPPLSTEQLKFLTDHCQTE